MSFPTAKIAVSAAPYRIDRVYDYSVPEKLRESLQPGCRVFVPFSRGNRICEGIVLALEEKEDISALKEIASQIDAQPVLSRQQISLAIFMRERFFCTIYEAVKAMLPSGLLLNAEGSARVKDRQEEYIKLAVPGEEAVAAAEEMNRRAPRQAEILRELSFFGCVSASELMEFTSSSRASLNALIKAGYAESFKTEVFRRPEISAVEHRELPVLNEEQSRAFEGLNALCERNEFKTALLQGVTGSGKTGVYIHLIDRALKRGQSAVLLVPEISLTPQMLRTFSSHFGEEIAVLHSRLRSTERYDEWKRIKSGKARLVIGTRSAVFAPLEGLGLIIIDEEQEESYKSENSPRYNAEEVAKYLCYKNSCMLLLGSATPKVTTRYYAQIGKYSRFTLEKRYNEQQLPEVFRVDMKKELRQGNSGALSGFLKKELLENIERGEQSILFLNRRGASALVRCIECGYVYRCPSCSVSLTYHSVGNRLMCHYCGFRKYPDSVCPECGGRLDYSGNGTQSLEMELNETFPGVPLLRMDTDVISAVNTHDVLFEKFASENIPIMLGTQMVTKGLNFENVTLVGVVDADQSLYTGSFRSAERTFSLITQVIGRGGRGKKPGRAVIQSFTPDNEVIICAARQDYEEFYRGEILLRELENAPPFADLLALTVSGTDEEMVINACSYAKSMLSCLLEQRRDVTLLGPAPLGVVKVSNRFRYRINIRCRADAELRRALENTIRHCSGDRRFRGMSFYADSDPAD